MSFDLSTHAPSEGNPAKILVIKEGETYTVAGLALIRGALIDAGRGDEIPAVIKAVREELDWWESWPAVDTCPGCGEQVSEGTLHEGVLF